MKDAFSRRHPITALCYFIPVLWCAMFCNHPACVAISLICAVVNAAVLGSWSARNLLLILPLAGLTMIINPLFSHEGATILAYLPGGNPLTLESMLYGLGAGAMLAAVVLWFSVVNSVLTPDKLVFLFGRVIPALSMVLSMALGFIPRFLAQARKIHRAQKQLGNGRSSLRDALRNFSVLITWSLESALDTADSMRSRGYGLPGRTAFSVFSWSRRDMVLLAWLLSAGAYVLFGLSALRWSYYPVLTGLKLDAYPLSVLFAYAALCLTPAVYGLWEEYRWRSLLSDI